MSKKVFMYMGLFILLFQLNTALLFCGEPVPQTSEASDYYIGPEDILEISVWKNEDLTREVVVRPDGKISFPLIGDVLAKGRTVKELRKIVEDKIQVLVPDMPVTIMVTQVGSQKVYVVGEVANPGVYIMGKTLRVMQVLGMAGGMTAYAKPKNIIIIRKTNGRQEIFKFNYVEVAGGKNLEQNICLQSSDTVVVP